MRNNINDEEFRKIRDINQFHKGPYDLVVVQFCQLKETQNSSLCETEIRSIISIV